VDELTTLTPRGEELSPRMDSPGETIKLDLPREPLMSDSSLKNMERLLGEVEYESSTSPRASPIIKNNRCIHKCVQRNVCLYICTYIYVYVYIYMYIHIHIHMTITIKITTAAAVAVNLTKHRSWKRVMMIGITPVMKLLKHLKSVFLNYLKNLF
jgi:hypothetical protein